MVTYVSRDFPQEFLHRWLPAFVAKRMRSNSNSVRAKAMDKALRDKYGVSLDEVILALSSTDMAQDDGAKERITVPAEATLNGHSLSEIVRFVDDGDLSVFGTGLYTDALRFVHDNAMDIYRLYIVSGGGY